jgi:hypothetical protein
MIVIAEDFFPRPAAPPLGEYSCTLTPQCGQVSASDEICSAHAGHVGMATLPGTAVRDILPECQPMYR